ncbi:molybdopterin-synthase adenylyltransferase MoeB [Chryseolinea lacunae]|uniref:Molybdopterin-synthase adenylyltransferase MoeB n=1 Tax=Chryseolinea lacunae TaxID=2801331 RepID=A0ABS1L198_9BACT|nr:molybdopterin-synthase adenylyltransferase MoeB [Chryseolinea lacunae]MBL0744306.1 molybdopterin-synthase adenylyltransferase MoeB [Chryseolinea lacunae]
MTTLTPEENIRYSRHLVLKEFGPTNQEKLKAACVMVVGAGGLGSPALLYLAAAGIGTLGIADGDHVELTNLQRQVLFTTDDIGKRKADAATERLHRLNPTITLQPYPAITRENALDILREFDVVIDGTDNFPTRYLLNDACVLLDKPLVYGSILRFEGHVSVFNMKDHRGENSAHYRDLFPEPPDASSVPNCEEAGVLGILPGMVGSMQATEAIKIITELGEPLANTLAIFDALSMTLSRIRYIKSPHRKPITELVDYEDFCGLNQQKNKSLNSNEWNTMKEITVQELKQLKDSGADFQLIDVREPHEFDICDLGGELIPQGDIPGSVDKIDRTKKVVIHCRSGARSGNMVQWLEKNHGFENLYNLKGGILAWAKEIDPEMPTY